MKRSSTLDIMRAVAIALVLGRHMEVCSKDTNAGLHYLTALWNRGGWVGVDLFFVRSGFLVSGLLFKEHQRYGAISFKHFIIRRGFKIYPPFYGLIAITVVVGLLKGNLDISRLLHELVFLQNYGKGGVWPQTWSLAVEEHFY